MTATSSTRSAGPITGSASSRRRASISNAPSSSSPKTRPSTTIWATPIGGSAACSRREFQWSHARDLKPEPDELVKIEEKLKSGLPEDTVLGGRRRAGEEARRRLSTDADAVATARAEPAPAKVNLTLRVIGRRADGYHDIESLVVFAGVGDALTFTPGRALALAVRGPTAPAAGDACRQSGAQGRARARRAGRGPQARALRAVETAAGRRRARRRLGRRRGGVAAARAREPARARRSARSCEAARATGADVPVCLDPRPRLMRGIGDVLSAPLELPRLPAVLVNPGVAVPTKDVFAALRLDTARNAGAPAPSPPLGGETRAALLRTLAAGRNDLEKPAHLAPAGDRRGALDVARACRLSSWRACRARARPASACSSRAAPRSRARRRCAPGIRAGGCARRCLAAKAVSTGLE